MIAWTHHEHFDGTGYPRGLAEEAIPLPGRIAAVADAFDAIATDRPHRRARPVAIAAEMLRAGREEQFDPAVLDAFLGALGAPHGSWSDTRMTAAARPADEYVRRQVAAQTLGASRSQLRRWADEGRIAAVRTRGGHRHLRLEDVRGLAEQLRTLPRYGRSTHPTGRCPGSPRAARPSAPRSRAPPRHRSTRTSRPAGSRPSTRNRRCTDGWASCGKAASTAATNAAIKVTATMLREARAHGATLLERHAFLERFAQVLTRTLGRQGVAQSELAGARRLVVALQQRALETYD